LCSITLCGTNVNTLWRAGTRLLFARTSDKWPNGAGEALGRARSEAQREGPVASTRVLGAFRYSEFRFHLVELFCS
jgi:hypothetical protein